MKHVAEVIELYKHDPYVSNVDYSKMAADADERDRDAEALAEAAWQVGDVNEPAWRDENPIMVAERAAWSALRQRLFEAGSPLAIELGRTLNDGRIELSVRRAV